MFWAVTLVDRENGDTGRVTVKNTFLQR